MPEVSIAEIHDQKQPEEERVLITSCREAGQQPGGRNQCKDHGGMLFTGWLNLLSYTTQDLLLQ